MTVMYKKEVVDEYDKFVRVDKEENDKMVILSCPKRFDDWVEERLKNRCLSAPELHVAVPTCNYCNYYRKKWLA